VGSSRPATINWDYDNNGASDAVETTSYDTAGRVLRTSYAYTGDGQVDRFNVFGTDPRMDEFAYDASGRGVSAFNTQVGGTTRFEVVYGAGGQAVRADVTATSGGSTFTGQFGFVYSGTLLTGLTRTLMGVSNGGSLFTYDAQGRRTSEVETDASGGAPVRTDYTWNADNTLATVRTDLDADGRNVRYQLTYVAGRQTRTVKTVGGIVFYTVDFSYDGLGRLAQARIDRFGDGTVDAVMTINWQTGPCTDVLLPLWDPLVDSVTAWGSSLRGESNRCGP
jgi:hypothetical protein